MTTLVINGKNVTVSDDFLKLSPDQQNATVDEIAKSMGSSPAATGAEAPQYAPNGVPMNAAAKAEIAAKAKAGTLAVSPESLAGSEAMTAKADAAMQPGFLSKAANAIGDFATAGTMGVARGAAAIPGIPGSLYDLQGAAIQKVGGMLGADPAETEKVAAMVRGLSPGGGLPSVGDITGAMSEATGGITDYRGKSLPAKFMGTVGEFLPGAAIFGGLNPTNLIRGAVVPGVASEGAGQATEGTALEPYARAAAGLLAPAALTGIENMASKAAAMGPWKAGIKSADDLLADAKNLYEAGRTSGTAATGKETRKLFDDLWSFGKSEDVITPANRIASDVSAVSSFYRMLKDYAGKTMPPGAMRSLRTEITAAMQTAKGNELRLLKGLQSKFDDFMYAKAPQFKEADKLYTMGMGGKEADEMAKLAEVRAGQFSQSGMENALRTEARGIERKLITGKERGYSPDEEAMISKMTARPSAVADQVAKFAPTSMMPIMANVGLGAAANSFLPGLGWIAAPASMVAGGLTKAALTRGQKSTAELFNLLRRTESGMLPSYSTASKTGAALRAIPGALAQ